MKAKCFSLLGESVHSSMFIMQYLASSGFHTALPHCSAPSCARDRRNLFVALIIVHQINVSKFIRILLKLLALKIMILVIASQSEHLAAVEINGVLECLCTMESQLPTQPKDCLIE